MASAGVCLAACRRVLADDYPDSRRAAQQDFDRLNPDFGVPADQHNSYGRQVILWVPGIRPPQAAWEYSWISPLSRSRRMTLPAGTTTAGSPGPSGGACPRARCGRCTL